MSSSFSYEDLVLSSQFERVMNTNKPTLNQSPSLSRPYLSMHSPPRPPLTINQPINQSINHIEPMTARPFDQFMEMSEQPTRARSQTVQPSSINPSNHSQNAADHAHFLQYGTHPTQQGNHRRSNQSINRSGQSINQSNQYSAISNHPAIQTRLRVIWYTLVAHASTNQSNNQSINQPINPMTVEYCQFDDFHRFYVRLTAVLLTPHYHAGLTQANSEADWLSISKLHTVESHNQSINPSLPPSSVRMLHRDRFYEWLFSVICMYVHLSDFAQFVFTLNKLYRGMTRSDSSLRDGISVSFAPMNEMPLLPLNDWCHTVSECELYMRAVCERCQWPLMNQGIDFSMPLLPTMRVEKQSEKMIQFAIRSRTGDSHFGVSQGPNRQSWCFSIAAMPAGYDALTEIAGLGSHLPDFWSPRHTLTRMMSAGQQSINQSINQSVPFDLNYDLSAKHSDDQKNEMNDEVWDQPILRDRARSMINQSNNQSNNQSINQSNNQSNNQSINQSTIIPIARRPSMPIMPNMNGPIQPKWIHR